MMVLIVPENTLEVGLDQAYKSFNESAQSFLETQGLNSSGPASKIVVKFFIAVGCGILGALFTFPGLRMARMHWDTIKYVVYIENICQFFSTQHFIFQISREQNYKIFIKFKFRPTLFTCCIMDQTNK